MDIVFVATGLALLLLGGHWLVQSGVALAHHLRLPGVVVGAVILGFGTSLPELLTSVFAALSGAPGIAVGNVMGSNIANILLILAVAVLIAPIAARTAPRSDLLALLAVTGLGLVVMWPGQSLGRLAGLGLIALLVGYVIWSVRKDPDAVQFEQVDLTRLKALGLLAVGFAGLLGGASLLVEGATNLARAAGIRETVIGLTLVAIGTSLPELVTSIIAARRGQSGLALGNVLGSNVFNILAVLGGTALIAPFAVPVTLSGVDLAVFAGAALGLVALLWVGRLGRVAGGTGLLLYAAYMGWLALNAA